MKKVLLISALLVFCSLPSQNAIAASDMGWKSVGFNVGYVDPSNIDGTVGFGAFADLGSFAKDWHLMPQLGYWSKSSGVAPYEFSVSDFSVGTRANYMFHVTSPKFQPYAGAGLGLHFVSAKAPVPDFINGGFTESTASSTKLGLDLGGGFATALSPKTDLTGDVWYTAASDVDHFSMKIGIAMKLGK